MPDKEGKGENGPGRSRARQDADENAGGTPVLRTGSVVEEVGGVGGEEPMVVPNGAVGTITDHDAAPLGTGLLVLTALGAGYAVTKRKK